MWVTGTLLEKRGKSEELFETSRPWDKGLVGAVRGRSGQAHAEVGLGSCQPDSVDRQKTSRRPSSSGERSQYTHINFGMPACSCRPFTVSLST